MSKTRTSNAVAGPTWDSQPVFAWTDEWSYIAHYGQVQVYDFTYIEMAPLFK